MQIASNRRQAGHIKSRACTLGWGRVEGKELIGVYGTTLTTSFSPFLFSFNQVPVAVYYESLCPDSAKFITEQLYPALKTELRDLVDITFVPFGKSHVSSVHICGHGHAG